ncbi:Senescence-specific cysteine protease SAG12 [Raphanus sativus]|uniref:Senescence-specific cysteine protease SAG12-like n=1 Tax=Raphanus sativus TaxID=3726 RepID=A0A6J0LKQ4_RAPSA|nr:senescence-specific cysteine protease SAG12-like [Raphanus sativus]KAJ4901501.1 Senescence-specific cysteine protease SAG12 [Raphanus sativus]
MALPHIQIFLIVSLVSSFSLSITLSRPLDEVTMQTRHAEWMTEHGRVYADAKEKHNRYVVFKRNVELIERLNDVQSGLTFKLAVNQFADLTNEEFRSMYTGYKGNSVLSSRTGTSFRYQNVSCDDLPTSIDWRKKGAVTPIKNQHTCGSCWAFSAVAAIEGAAQIKNGKLISLSEQELVDCDTNDYGCMGGLMDSAFNFTMTMGGLTSESNYPYKKKDGTCKIKKTKQIVTSIKGFEDVPPNDEKALMKAVAHQPVSIAVAGGDIGFQFYKSGVFSGECTTNLDHGVTLVGYGRSSNGLKYWILKNSWGPKWGERGYMRIKKDVKPNHGECGLAMNASYPTM